MAIDSNIYSPTQFRFAIAEETTLGTPITAQGSFHELLITEPPQIDYGGMIRDKAKKSDSKRVWSHTDTYANTHGGFHTVSVTGILTDLTVDLLLFGVMQDLTSEADTTPYLKTFTWDEGTTGNNSGKPYKFFTLNGYDPGASRSWQLESCVIQSLDISAAYGTNGGRASFTAVFYSGHPPVYGATVTPASNPGWVSFGTDYYPIYTLQTKTVASAEVVVDSFNISWNNGAVRVGADVNGDAQTYHFPMFDVTGSVKVKYDANTKEELTKFVLTPDGGSAESQINLVWGNGSANGTLAFDINAIYTGNGKDFGNESGVFVDLPFEGVDDGTDEAIEVLCANATDRIW